MARYQDKKVVILGGTSAWVSQRRRSSLMAARAFW
jgi:hypothetical protein